MPLIQDVLEKVSMQELLDRIQKLENIQGILQHNLDTVMHEQDREDAADTRAS